MGLNILNKRVKNSRLSALAENLSGSMKYIYGTILALILTICLFCSHMDYSYKKTMEHTNWQYLSVGVLVIVALFWGIAVVDNLFARKRGKDQNNAQSGGVTQKKPAKFYSRTGFWMLLVNLLFFAGLVFCSYHYYFKTGWDAQTVEGTANLIAMGKYEEAQNRYFSFYPNNVFLTFLFSVVIKLGYAVGVSNYYFVIIVFQCLLFGAAGYLVYCCAEKLLNSTWAVGVWALYALFVGMSPWVVIPYSDATGVFFPILIFYIYLCIRSGRYIRCNLVLLTLVSYVGYRIKPQILIMLIGIGIVEILEFVKSDACVRKIWQRRLLWPVLGILLGMGVVTAGVKATRLQIDEELVFSIPHYLMMGLNEEFNGVINLEDQDFSMSYATVEERTRANLQVATERVREMGVPGLLKLWTRKTLTNFSDGTFAWWEEGEFYSQEMYEGNYYLRSLLSRFYYRHGGGFEGFVNYMQALWMGILFLATMASLKGKHHGAENALMLSIVGLFLFETVFEARARYLFIYAPVFVLLAGLGAHRIWSSMGKRLRKTSGNGILQHMETDECKK